MNYETKMYVKSLKKHVLSPENGAAILICILADNLAIVQPITRLISLTKQNLGILCINKLIYVV